MRPTPASVTSSGFVSLPPWSPTADGPAPAGLECSQVSVSGGEANVLSTPAPSPVFISPSFSSPVVLDSSSRSYHLAPTASVARRCTAPTTVLHRSPCTLQISKFTRGFPGSSSLFVQPPSPAVAAGLSTPFPSLRAATAADMKARLQRQLERDEGKYRGASAVKASSPTRQSFRPSKGRAPAVCAYASSPSTVLSQICQAGDFHLRRTPNLLTEQNGGTASAGAVRGPAFASAGRTTYARGKSTKSDFSSRARTLSSNAGERTDQDPGQIHSPTNSASESPEPHPTGAFHSGVIERSSGGESDKQTTCFPDADWNGGENALQVRTQPRGASTRKIGEAADWQLEIYRTAQKNDTKMQLSSSLDPRLPTSSVSPHFLSCPASASSTSSFFSSSSPSLAPVVSPNPARHGGGSSRESVRTRRARRNHSSSRSRQREQANERKRDTVPQGLPLFGQRRVPTNLLPPDTCILPEQSALQKKKEQAAEALGKLRGGLNSYQLTEKSPLQRWTLSTLSHKEAGSICNGQGSDVRGKTDKRGRTEQTEKGRLQRADLGYLRSVSEAADKALERSWSRLEERSKSGFSSQSNSLNASPQKVSQERDVADAKVSGVVDKPILSCQREEGGQQDADAKHGERQLQSPLTCLDDERSRERSSNVLAKEMDDKMRSEFKKRRCGDGCAKKALLDNEEPNRPGASSFLGGICNEHVSSIPLCRMHGDDREARGRDEVKEQPTSRTKEKYSPVPVPTTAGHADVSNTCRSSLLGRKHPDNDHLSCPRLGRSSSVVPSSGVSRPNRERVGSTTDLTASLGNIKQGLVHALQEAQFRLQFCLAENCSGEQTSHDAQVTSPLSTVPLCRTPPPAVSNKPQRAESLSNLEPKRRDRPYAEGARWGRRAYAANSFTLFEDNCTEERKSSDPAGIARRCGRSRCHSRRGRLSSRSCDELLGAEDTEDSHRKHSRSPEKTERVCEAISTMDHDESQNFHANSPGVAELSGRVTELLGLSEAAKSGDGLRSFSFLPAATGQSQGNGSTGPSFSSALSSPFLPSKDGSAPTQDMPFRPRPSKEVLDRHRRDTLALGKKSSKGTSEGTGKNSSRNLRTIPPPEEDKTESLFVVRHESRNGTPRKKPETPDTKRGAGLHELVSEKVSSDPGLRDEVRDCTITRNGSARGTSVASAADHMNSSPGGRFHVSEDKSEGATLSQPFGKLLLQKPNKRVIQTASRGDGGQERHFSRSCSGTRRSLPVKKGTPDEDQRVAEHACNSLSLSLPVTRLAAAASPDSSTRNTSRPGSAWVARVHEGFSEVPTTIGQGGDVKDQGAGDPTLKLGAPRCPSRRGQERLRNETTDSSDSAGLPENSGERQEILSCSRESSSLSSNCQERKQQHVKACGRPEMRRARSNAHSSSREGHQERSKETPWNTSLILRRSSMPVREKVALLLQQPCRTSQPTVVTESGLSARQANPVLHPYEGPQENLAPPGKRTLGAGIHTAAAVQGTEVAPARRGAVVSCPTRSYSPMSSLVRPEHENESGRLSEHAEGSKLARRQPFATCALTSRDQLGQGPDFQREKRQLSTAVAGCTDRAREGAVVLELQKSIRPSCRTDTISPTLELRTDNGKSSAATEEKPGGIPGAQGTREEIREGLPRDWSEPKDLQSETTSRLGSQACGRPQHSLISRPEGSATADGGAAVETEEDASEAGLILTFSSQPSPLVGPGTSMEECGSIKCNYESDRATRGSSPSYPVESMPPFSTLVPPPTKATNKIEASVASTEQTETTVENLVEPELLTCVLEDASRTRPLHAVLSRYSPRGQHFDRLLERHEKRFSDRFAEHPTPSPRSLTFTAPSGRPPSTSCAVPPSSFASSDRERKERLRGHDRRAALLETEGSESDGVTIEVSASCQSPFSVKRQNALHSEPEELPALTGVVHPLERQKSRVEATAGSFCKGLDMAVSGDAQPIPKESASWWGVTGRGLDLLSVIFQRILQRHALVALMVGIPCRSPLEGNPTFRSFSGPLDTPSPLPCRRADTRTQSALLQQRQEESWSQRLILLGQEQKRGSARFLRRSNDSHAEPSQSGYSQTTQKEQDAADYPGGAEQFFSPQEVHPKFSSRFACSSDVGEPGGGPVRRKTETPSCFGVSNVSGRRSSHPSDGTRFFADSVGHGSSSSPSSGSVADCSHRSVWGLGSRRSSLAESESIFPLETSQLVGKSCTPQGHKEYIVDHCSQSYPAKALCGGGWPARERSCLTASPAARVESGCREKGNDPAQPEKSLENKKGDTVFFSSAKKGFEKSPGNKGETDNLEKIEPILSDAQAIEAGLECCKQQDDGSGHDEARRLLRRQLSTSSGQLGSPSSSKQEERGNLQTSNEQTGRSGRFAPCLENTAGEKAGRGTGHMGSGRSTAEDEVTRGARAIEDLLDAVHLLVCALEGDAEDLATHILKQGQPHSAAFASFIKMRARGAERMPEESRPRGDLRMQPNPGEPRKVIPEEDQHSTFSVPRAEVDNCGLLEETEEANRVFVGLPSTESSQVRAESKTSGSRAPSLLEQPEVRTEAFFRQMTADSEAEVERNLERLRAFQSQLMSCGQGAAEEARRQQFSLLPSSRFQRAKCRVGFCGTQRGAKAKVTCEEVVGPSSFEDADSAVVCCGHREIKAQRTPQIQKIGGSPERQVLGASLDTLEKREARNAVYDTDVKEFPPRQLHVECLRSGECQHIESERRTEALPFRAAAGGPREGNNKARLRPFSPDGEKVHLALTERADSDEGVSADCERDETSKPSLHPRFAEGRYRRNADGKDELPAAVQMSPGLTGECLNGAPVVMVTGTRTEGEKGDRLMKPHTRAVNKGSPARKLEEAEGGKESVQPTVVTDTPTPVEGIPVPPGEKVFLPRSEKQFVTWEQRENTAAAALGETGGVLSRSLRVPARVGGTVLNGRGCDRDVGDAVAAKSSAGTLGICREDSVGFHDNTYLRGPGTLDRSSQLMPPRAVDRAPRTGSSSPSDLSRTDSKNEETTLPTDPSHGQLQQRPDEVTGSTSNVLLASPQSGVLFVDSCLQSSVGNCESENLSVSNNDDADINKRCLEIWAFSPQVSNFGVQVATSEDTDITSLARCGSASSGTEVLTEGVATVLGPQKSATAGVEDSNGRECCTEPPGQMTAENANQEAGMPNPYPKQAAGYGAASRLHRVTGDASVPAKVDVKSEERTNFAAGNAPTVKSVFSSTPVGEQRKDSWYEREHGGMLPSKEVSENKLGISGEPVPGQESECFLDDGGEERDLFSLDETPAAGSPTGDGGAQSAGPEAQIPDAFSRCGNLPVTPLPQGLQSAPSGAWNEVQLNSSDNHGQLHVPQTADPTSPGGLTVPRRISAWSGRDVPVGDTSREPEGTPKTKMDGPVQLIRVAEEAERRQETSVTLMQSLSSEKNESSANALQDMQHSVRCEKTGPPESEPPAPMHTSDETYRQREKEQRTRSLDVYCMNTHEVEGSGGGRQTDSDPVVSASLLEKLCLAEEQGTESSGENPEADMMSTRQGTSESPAQFGGKTRSSDGKTLHQQVDKVEAVAGDRDFAWWYRSVNLQRAITPPSLQALSRTEDIARGGDTTSVQGTKVGEAVVQERQDARKTPSPDGEQEDDQSALAFFSPLEEREHLPSNEDEGKTESVESEEDTESDNKGLCSGASGTDSPDDVPSPQRQTLNSSVPSTMAVIPALSAAHTAGDLLVGSPKCVTDLPRVLPEQYRQAISEERTWTGRGSKSIRRSAEVSRNNAEPTVLEPKGEKESLQHTMAGGIAEDSTSTNKEQQLKLLRATRGGDPSSLESSPPSENDAARAGHSPLKMPDLESPQSESSACPGVRRAACTSAGESRGAGECGKAACRPATSFSSRKSGGTHGINDSSVPENPEEEHDDRNPVVEGPSGADQPPDNVNVSRQVSAAEEPGAELSASACEAARPGDGVSVSAAAPTAEGAQRQQREPLALALPLSARTDHENDAVDKNENAGQENQPLGRRSAHETTPQSPDEETDEKRTENDIAPGVREKEDVALPPRGPRLSFGRRASTQITVQEKDSFGCSRSSDALSGRASSSASRSVSVSYFGPRLHGNAEAPSLDPQLFPPRPLPSRTVIRVDAGAPLVGRPTSTDPANHSRAQCAATLRESPAGSSECGVVRRVQLELHKTPSQAAAAAVMGPSAHVAKGDVPPAVPSSPPSFSPASAELRSNEEKKQVELAVPGARCSADSPLPPPSSPECFNDGAGNSQPGTSEAKKKQGATGGPNVSVLRGSTKQMSRESGSGMTKQTRGDVRARYSICTAGEERVQDCLVGESVVPVASVSQSPQPTGSSAPRQKGPGSTVCSSTCTSAIGVCPKDEHDQENNKEQVRRSRSIGAAVRRLSRKYRREGRYQEEAQTLASSSQSRLADQRTPEDITRGDGTSHTSHSPKAIHKEEAGRARSQASGELDVERRQQLMPSQSCRPLCRAENEGQQGANGQRTGSGGSPEKGYLSPDTQADKGHAPDMQCSRKTAPSTTSSDYHQKGGSNGVLQPAAHALPPSVTPRMTLQEQQRRSRGHIVTENVSGLPGTPRGTKERDGQISSRSLFRKFSFVSGGTARHLCDSGASVFKTGTAQPSSRDAEGTSHEGEKIQSSTVGHMVMYTSAARGKLEVQQGSRQAQQHTRQAFSRGLLGIRRNSFGGSPLRNARNSTARGTCGQEGGSRMAPVIRLESAEEGGSGGGGAAAPGQEEKSDVSRKTVSSRSFFGGGKKGISVASDVFRTTTCTTRSSNSVDGACSANVSLPRKDTAASELESNPVGSRTAARILLGGRNSSPEKTQLPLSGEDEHGATVGGRASVSNCRPRRLSRLLGGRTTASAAIPPKAGADRSN